MGGSCLPSAVGRTALFRLSSFLKRLLLLNLGDHCIKQTLLMLDSSWHYQVLGKHPLRTSGLGIQLTRTIYTHIPPVASVSIEATLPRGGVQFLCRKPLRQPCKSRTRGNRNKMVFLQPVSTFEITWEDFMRGKVNQVQKHIPNYFSSPVFATSGCTTRCCLSQWVIYLGKKKIVQEDAIA